MKRTTTVKKALKGKGKAKLGSVTMLALLEMLDERPGIAYQLVREQQNLFNISAIEQQFNIPAGSLSSSNKRLHQIDYKHSDKLANLLATLFSRLAELHTEAVLAETTENYG